MSSQRYLEDFKYSQFQLYEQLSSRMPDWFYLYLTPRQTKVQDGKSLPMPVVLAQGRTNFLQYPSSFCCRDFDTLYLSHGIDCACSDELCAASQMLKNQALGCTSSDRLYLLQSLDLMHSSLPSAPVECFFVGQSYNKVTL